MNSRIFTNGHFQENRENYIYGKIGKNREITPITIFAIFPQK